MRSELLPDHALLIAQWTYTRLTTRTGEPQGWGQLGWVMLRGHAEILNSGSEHDQAQALLRCRYPQLKRMRIAELPVIAVHIVSATSWGNLSLETSD